VHHDPPYLSLWSTGVTGISHHAKPISGFEL
jgi:hypothetical protein